MDRIGGPLADLLSRLRLSDPLEGWQAVDLWAEVVGERVASKSRAVRYDQGTLFVEVDSPAWMSELTYLKAKVVRDLNRKLGHTVIREVRFRPAATGGPEMKTE